VSGAVQTFPRGRKQFPCQTPKQFSSQRHPDPRIFDMYSLSNHLQRMLKVPRKNIPLPNIPKLIFSS
jgi:hypothetical protein